MIKRTYIQISHHWWSSEQKASRSSVHSGRTVLEQIKIIGEMIVKGNKHHPYKIEMLTEDGSDRRTEFGETATKNIVRPIFKILITVKNNFFLNGNVHRQNCRYWSVTSSHLSLKLILTI